jgi:hypothetical protein
MPTLINSFYEVRKELRLSSPTYDLCKNNLKYQKITKNQVKESINRVYLVTVQERLSKFHALGNWECGLVKNRLRWAHNTTY